MQRIEFKSGDWLSLKQINNSNVYHPPMRIFNQRNQLITILSPISKQNKIWNQLITILSPISKQKNISMKITIPSNKIKIIIQIYLSEFSVPYHNPFNIYLNILFHVTILSTTILSLFHVTNLSIALRSIRPCHPISKSESVIS